MGTSCARDFALKREKSIVNLIDKKSHVSMITDQDNVRFMMYCDVMNPEMLIKFMINDQRYRL
ncbi:MAG: hypothetical protein L7F78_23530 [Syntrophales bacterium LBB04]|nr:hypothetical protein [Syntrophales bacterium LBB04]